MELIQRKYALRKYALPDHLFSIWAQSLYNVSKGGLEEGDLTLLLHIVHNLHQKHCITYIEYVLVLAHVRVPRKQPNECHVADNTAAEDEFSVYLNTVPYLKTVPN